MKKDPFCPCLVKGCPFRIVNDYLSACPSPFGEKLTKTGEAEKELFFMRSKTTRGDPHFLLGRMGESSLSKIIPELNSILPSSLRSEHATAHSGRHSASSIAYNAGVSPVTIAKTTHHKDPKIFAQYAHSDPRSKQVTGQAIGKVVFSRDDFVEDDLEEDDFTQR